MRLQRRKWFGVSLAMGAVLSLASFVTAVAQAQHPSINPPADAQPGRVDVGDFQLFATCAGAGDPTVILDAGAGDSSSVWKQLQPRLATITQVCAYDRANSGYSDTRPSAGPDDALLNATELHTLLTEAQIMVPYVLVGHSYAGAVDQVYASQYPEDVAGLVLVDPVAGEFLKGQVRFYDGGLAIPTSHEREGVIDLDTSRQQVEASSLPNVPLIVLTAQLGAYGGTPQSLALHAAIAAKSPRGKQVIVPNSGHRIFEAQPDAVIAAVREVVDAARMATPEDNQ
jgi:pimeloyl-ACP methyl ester carboxylesterase